MPVVNSVIVPILPNDGKGVGAYGNHIADARRRRISQPDIEHFRIGFRPHILVPPAAGGARTGRAQQFKWIDARMIVVPCDGEFPGLLVGSNARWFFVHVSSKMDSKSPDFEISTTGAVGSI